MNEFPSHIKFKYQWRSYQEKVLHQLDSHLDDNQLYIIAPPGSGKTVLGLEVVLRLNKPTLILTPSITIRNQWILRFQELFIDSNVTPDWISTDVHNPNFLTVCTYQAVHSLISSGEELHLSPEKILTKYVQLKTATVVVDEAHHLKNSWWSSLTTLKETLEPTTVSLTATPPYDTSYAEWNRYLEFNGEIDAEIFVPSLVKEKDLCPHQDYVFFCTPSKEETQELTKHHDTVRDIYEELKGNVFLKEFIEKTSYFKTPLEELEWIYSHIEIYSSILIFLNANNVEISISHLDIIGNKNLIIPDLDRTWLQTLLTHLLFEHEFIEKENENYFKALYRKLYQGRLIEHKKINFSNNFNSNNLLRNSISKLKGIEEITKSEYDSLGSNLREVILTDYIRKEYFNAEDKNSILLKKIGVGSIFERLRRSQIDKLQIAVLTGSIVIIPIHAKNRIDEISQSQGISLNYKKLSYDDNYLIVLDNSSSKTVEFITQLFKEGFIHVLIGTKALLGEGWDAPAINTLLLASFVGSFVSSNQMRGRAIRKNEQLPDKAANIWHLISFDKYDSTGGYDYELLKRRFKTFVGLSNTKETYISNGHQRLNLPLNLHLDSNLKDYNNKTLEKAKSRNSLFELWNTAIKKGSIITKEIVIPFPAGQSFPKTKTLYFNKTIKNAIATVISILMSFIQSILNFIINNTQLFRNLTYLLYTIAAGGFLGIIIYGRLLIKTATVYLKYRDISKDIENISVALLKTMCNGRIISTAFEQITIHTSQDSKGNIITYLTGTSSYENNLFTESLAEIINSIDNPRYLISRSNKLWKVFHQKDYHSVPDIIGRNKKTAKLFLEYWNENVCNSNLIFTRNVEGRKHLLHARFNSLSAEFVTNAESYNSWH